MSKRRWTVRTCRQRRKRYEIDLANASTWAYAKRQLHIIMHCPLPLRCGAALALGLATLKADIHKSSFAGTEPLWTLPTGATFADSTLAGGAAPELRLDLSLDDVRVLAPDLVRPLSLQDVISAAGLLHIPTPATEANGVAFIGHLSPEPGGVPGFRVGLYVSVADGQARAWAVLHAGSWSLQTTEWTLPTGAAHTFSVLYLPNDRQGHPSLIGILNGEAKVATAEGTLPPGAFEARQATHFAIRSEPLSGVATTQAPLILHLDNLSYAAGFSDATPSNATVAEAVTRAAAHRWQPLVVEVLDNENQPVAEATVQVRQVKGDFGLGTAVTERLFSEDVAEPGRSTLKALIPVLFERTVLENGHKWDKWESETRRPMTDATVAWLRDMDLDLRGHTMVWQRWDFIPDDVDAAKDDPAFIRQRVEAHILDIGSKNAGLVTDWDVINEQFQENVLTDILNPGISQHQPPEAVRWFQLARQSDPNAVLYVNDFGILTKGNHRSAYGTFISYLLREGAPLGGIGCQSHFWDINTRPTPEGLKIGLDSLSSYDLDMKVTEFDLYGPGWTAESMRAYTAEFVQMIEAEPDMRDFIIWGFWDGRHWQSSAALFNQDWSLKPMGEVLLDSFYRKGRTRATGTTNAQGIFEIPARCGTYEVTITSTGGTETRTVVVSRPSAFRNPFAGWASGSNSLRPTYLGALNDKHFPWCHTVEHGWFLADRADGAKCWVYDPTPGLGWWYTGPKLYPWIYSPTQGWLYVLPSGAYRWIYHDREGIWKAYGRGLY